jgi:hypothetical protein
MFSQYVTGILETGLLLLYLLHFLQNQDQIISFIIVLLAFPETKVASISSIYFVYFLKSIKDSQHSIHFFILYSKVSVTSLSFGSFFW